MLRIFILGALLSMSAHAKIKVMTTTTNLRSLVEEVGGDLVSVESFCKGTQDPHFLEAKPSYIFKLSKADLLISVGADLEVGWLPLIIRGSRNPALKVGGKRHLIAASQVSLIGVSDKLVSRAHGDVHPGGNPHFMLSPSKAIHVGRAIRDKLIELDTKNSKSYKENFDSFQIKMQMRIEEWKKLKINGSRVVTYHKLLTYFFKEFAVEQVDVLEPKPGVPPSAGHILNLIRKMKKQSIKKILVENYFHDKIARRVQKEVPGTKVQLVPVAVDGLKEVKDLFSLYEYLVQSLRF